MPGHAYLLRSRHDVFYLRMVIPTAIRTSFGLAKREVRLSLRTKDRKIARVRLAESTLAMSKLFQELEDWEIEADERFEKYKHGLKLINQHGRYNLDDEFDRSYISEELSGKDLEAYVFALEHLENKVEKTATKVAKAPSAKHKRNQPASLNETTKPVNQTAAQNNRPDETIQTALTRFAQSKSNAANAATIEKYQSQIRLFIKVVGDGSTDLKLSDLTSSHMHRYSDALHNLPPKISPNDQRTLEELKKSSDKKMSQRTKSAHARAVSMFLTWCEEQQYQIAPNLHQVLKPLRKPPKPTNTRKHFLPHELKAIFESERYKNKQFQRDSDYWIPIIGLLTGAREAELCQLYASDIYQDSETSIWVIDINDDGPDKRLKTATSRRLVPIHSKLLDFGFHEFAQRAETNGQQRLFANEHRNKRDEFDAFSKRFNRYITDAGIVKSKTQLLNFHSLRHTFQTDLLDQGEEEYIVNQLVGHSPANRSQSVSTYSKGASLERRREALQRFRLSIQLYPR